MSDKPFPPSAKKLRDARKKGEIPKSAQVISTAVFATVLFVTLLGMPATLKRMRGFFDAVEAVLAGHVNEDMVLQLYERSLSAFMWIVLPVIVASIAAAIAAGWFQTKGLLSLAPLEPKLDRLNPASNLKKLVSMKQMLDLAKKLLETVALGGLIVWVTWSAVGSTLLGVYQPATETALSGAHLLFVMFAAAAVFWVAISALDYGIQYFSFMREQRMSFEDIKREHKDMEGDPHVKAQRRALQQEMAQKAAARSVKGARALIANPTHVSVAIAFTSVETGLPYVLAKGLDAQALAMRAEAEQLGIPIFEDVPLARALHRKLELDAVITQEFYAPIARVIVWVQQLAESDLDQPDNPTHTDRITH